MSSKVEHNEKMNERIFNQLTTVNNIPSAPFIIQEVSGLIGDPKTNAAILGKIISKDQGLVTKILTVANSPLYGIPRRVSTIDFAIVVLGFEQIKNIVIALSMLETLRQMGDKKFEQNKYMKHAIITAAASQRIADDLGYQTSGEAFTAGLLHDLGILVIYKIFNKEFGQITEAVKKEGISYLEAEEKFLGLTHQEIGGFLIDRWNLPYSITDVISYHHKPSQAQNHTELTALVHLADYMTKKLLTGNYSWDDSSVLDKDVIDILNLGDEEYLENFIYSYKNLFEGQLNSIRI